MDENVTAVEAAEVKEAAPKAEAKAEEKKEVEE